MPSALLEQSRNVLRSRFSVVLPKRIFTLQFDRSCDDSVEIIASLFAKLRDAQQHRGIVCAAPEAVKSLVLKFVEQLHSLEGPCPPIRLYLIVILAIIQAWPYFEHVGDPNPNPN